MHIKIDLKNYDHKNTVFKRTAARAVIKYENKYLLIFASLGITNSRWRCRRW